MIVMPAREAAAPMMYPGLAEMDLRPNRSASLDDKK